MTAEIRVTSSPGEVRVAVTVAGILTDFAIWRPGSPDGVGDIHRGRIIRSVPAMAGAFVAIGGTEGFLPDSEGAKGLTDGTMLTVRVTRSAQGGKGPRLSTRATDGIEAQGGIGLLRRGPDAVTRLAALWPDAPIIVDDPGLLLGPPGCERVVDRSGFDDELLTQIDALREPEVILPGGARVAFHPTPALVAIDVDAAGALAERGARHGDVNRALIPDLARQIRLRNLSGAILIDFAGMAVRKRASLGPSLNDALTTDPLRPRLLGFTALGLAEIVRPRIHPPLHEVLAGPLSAGLEALRHTLAWMLEHPGRVPTLCVAPEVEEALARDRQGFSELAERAGLGALVRTDRRLPALGWALDV